MPEVVVVGGFGSSPEQMKCIARRIGEHLGKTALGINFRMAIHNTERLAEVIHDRTVITHSGGAKAVADSFEQYGAKPESLIAIAPPIPEQVRKLLWRGALIGLGVQQAVQDQLEEKFTATEELLYHPVANLGRVHELGHFAAIDEIARIRQGSADTTIALMNQDGLFNLTTSSVKESVERARQMGVRIVNLYGQHCRFSQDPIGVMHEIAKSNHIMRAVAA